MYTRRSTYIHLTDHAMHLLFTDELVKYINKPYLPIPQKHQLVKYKMEKPTTQRHGNEGEKS